jgi:hypothetical protein
MQYIDGSNSSSMMQNGLLQVRQSLRTVCWYKAVRFRANPRVLHLTPALRIQHPHRIHCAPDRVPLTALTTSDIRQGSSVGKIQRGVVARRLESRGVQ